MTDGQTARAIVGAPRNSIYVWPYYHNIGYAKSLARNLGRDDLVIIAVSEAVRYCYSSKFTDVVFDHSINEEEIKKLQEIKSRAIMNKLMNEHTAKQKEEDKKMINRIKKWLDSIRKRIQSLWGRIR